MNSTTNKEKWWIYLIFLFVGIISLFSGLFIGEIPLFDGGLLVMLLPLPICSYLLHLTIAAGHHRGQYPREYPYRRPPLDPGFSLTGVMLWLVIVLVFSDIASF
jgi:hypothetical protein